MVNLSTTAQSLVASREPVPAMVVAAERPHLVLHVEDDAAIRASVQMLMRSAGLSVISVASGAEALRCVREEHLEPDVLIVDFQLQEEMTGADVAEALARLIGHAPPTIVLTADTSNAELPWIVGSPVWMLSNPAGCTARPQRSHQATGNPAPRGQACVAESGLQAEP